MSVVARRPPHLGRPSRRTLIITAAIVAFLGLGGGGALIIGSLMSGTGHGGAGGVGTAANPSASPTATSTPTVKPMPTTTPTPSALAGLTCTIAVSGTWTSGSGGFLSFPGGQFKPDPASTVLTPDGNFYGLTHVLALNRWVAVPRDWVTPDGRSYVYPSWGPWGQSLGVVHADGSMATLPLPSSSNTSWRILSAEADGVYVSAQGYQAVPGLYRVGYDGKVTRVVEDGFWQAVGFGYAYGTVTASVPEGASNTVFRQSLSSGGRTDVFSRPGLASTVVGFDAAGSAVFEARSSATAEVWLAGAGGGVLLLSDATTQMLPGPMGGQQGLHVYSAIGDAHGLWIATTKGLYLYTPGAGVESASTVAGPLGSTCR